LSWLLQIAAAIIAIFGFDGYAFPDKHIQPCRFCSYSSGGSVFAWTSKKVWLQSRLIR